MPRELPDGLKTLLAQPGGYPYSTWLELVLPNVVASPSDVEGSTHRLATNAIEVDGVMHRVELNAIGDLQHSVNREVSRTTVSLQNTTTSWGRLLLGKSDKLQGGTARMGRWYKHPVQDKEPFVVQMFTGVVEGIGGDHKSVTLKLLSDVYAILSVGGGRLAERTCQAVYNSPVLRALQSLLGEACGYLGGLPTCDKTIDGPNGCVVHDNLHRYQGAANIKSTAGISQAAGLSPQKNYQLIRNEADEPSMMRTALKVVGATFADDEANDQTIMTLTGGTGTECGKFSWYASIGDDGAAISTQRIITFRPQRPGSITGWSLFADAECAVTVDIQKGTFADYPLDSADSMPGSGNEPAIATAQKAEGDTTAWDTAEFLGGDVVEVVLTVAETAPNYLGVVLYGEYSACDNPTACGANWTMDLPNWENTGGSDRPSNLYDAMQQGDVLIEEDLDAVGFISHSTDAEAFIGVMGENCPAPFHHEVGNYDYWFRGLATQYAAFELKDDGTWEVWQDDEATGVTGSYTDGTEFLIQRMTGGTDLELFVDSVSVFTTDLLGLSEPRELPASVRMVALGGAAGALIELL